MLIDGTTYRESYASAQLCPTEECGPSRPLQLANVKLKDSMNVYLLLSYRAHVKYMDCKKTVNACLYRYSTVSYTVLAMTCICVIYKFLS